MCGGKRENVLLVVKETFYVTLVFSIGQESLHKFRIFELDNVNAGHCEVNSTVLHIYTLRLDSTSLAPIIYPLYSLIFNVFIPIFNFFKTFYVYRYRYIISLFPIYFCFWRANYSRHLQDKHIYWIELLYAIDLSLWRC